MKTRGNLSVKPFKTYFVTSTIVGWIDVFTRKELRDIVMDSLRFCIKNKGLNIYSYCIMSNHIHMVVNSNEPYLLSDTLRDFKRHTSVTIFDWILNNRESRRDWMSHLLQTAGENATKQTRIKMWQTGNFPIELFSPYFTWQKINYIHQNPVKAGLVRKAEDYIYSSASNYVGVESLLEEVILVTPPLNY